MNASGRVRGLIVAVVMAIVLMSFTACLAPAPAVTNAPPTTGSGGRSSPPDLSHPSRPAIAADNLPRPSAPAAPGVSTPVVVDPAVSNTTPNFRNTDTTGGTEPSVALNPANPLQVVITSFSIPSGGAWNATQNAPLWYSADGGSTWTKEFTIPVPPGRNPAFIANNPSPPPSTVTIQCPCDQTIDYARNGTLFGTFLIGDGSTVNRTNIVSGDTTDATSAASWQWNGNPVQLTNNAHPNNADQPWLLVNRDPTTAGQDDAWSAYDDFGTNPINGQVAVSANAAPPNFTVDNSPGAEAQSDSTNPGLRLAKDPRNGAMYALWQTTTGATSPHPTTLHVNRSTNGGANWTLNGNAGGLALPAGQADDGDYKFGGVNALLGGVHHAAVDPSNGDVYVVYGNDNANNGVGNQLLIRRLTDNGSGGLNVGAAVTISNASSTALPSVAVTANGTVGVLYDTFDGTSGPPGNFPKFSAHLATSTDHGQTFTDTVLEQFLSPSTNNGNARQRVLGDFQQLKANGDLFYGVFSGNRVPLNGGTGTSVIDPVFFESSSDQPITATGQDITATEGAGFSGTVARFTDQDTSATASEYSATIDWGDATPPTTGTVTGTAGNFAVGGAHTYADEGPYPLTVTITDTDNPLNTATTSSTARVADAALTATGVTVVSPQSFSGTVATFTDANPLATTADFTATITWGDGSVPSAGTVSSAAGNFAVTGAHTYSSTGFFTVTVKIVDDGGSTATATSTILIFGTPASGDFVIGDGNATIGGNVTFWGARWASLNTLSRGPAPPSFKGFEDSPPVSSCATNWTTDPGNSTPPPAGPLPAFMGVIVSSSVSKSGSSIAGNSVHIVVVKTNPGYQSDPGHAGTGTVIATFC